MKLSLVVLNSGKAEGQTIPITTTQFFIGRDPKCHLRPASALISTRHCAIFVREGKVYIRDFDSTNGTFVNEEKVKGDVLVKHDDVIKAGPLTFKLVVSSTPTVEKQTPPPMTKPVVKPVPAKAQASATPPPMPKPTKTIAKTAQTEDDDVGDLLLALDDDPAGEPKSSALDDGVVPEGSTVMDIPALEASSKPGEEKKSEPAKPADAPKYSTGKPANDSAQSAASALLDRMKKGNRNRG